MRLLLLALLGASLACAQKLDYPSQIKNGPMLDPRGYAWRQPASHFTANLSAAGTGKALVFTGFCPDGLRAGNSLYISGGTGTAEVAAITGSTCAAGVGTVTITTANTHSGNYFIGSATSGLQEAEVVRYLNAGNGVLIPAGVITLMDSVRVLDQAHFRGTGPGSAIVPPSSTGVAFLLQGSQPGQNGMTFRDFLIDGQSYGGINTAYGIKAPLQNTAWMQGNTDGLMSGVTCNNIRYCFYGERLRNWTFTDIHLYSNSTMKVWDAGNGSPNYRNYDLNFKNIIAAPDCYHGSNIACTTLSLSSLQGPDATIACWKCINTHVNGFDVEDNNGLLSALLLYGSSEGIYVDGFRLVGYTGYAPTNRADMVTVADGWYVNGSYVQQNMENGQTNTPQAVRFSNGIMDQCSGTCINFLASAYPQQWFDVDGVTFTSHPTSVSDAAIHVGNLFKSVRISGSHFKGRFQRAVDVTNASGVSLDHNDFTLTPFFKGSVTADSVTRTHVIWAGDSKFNSDGWTTGGATVGDPIALWPAYGAGAAVANTISSSCGTTPDDNNMCLGTSLPTYGDNPGDGWFWQLGPTASATINTTTGLVTIPSTSLGFISSHLNRSINISGKWYRVTKVTSGTTAYVTPVPSTTTGILIWGTSGIASTGGTNNLTLTQASGAGQPFRSYMVGRELTLYQASTLPTPVLFTVSAVNSTTSITLTPKTGGNYQYFGTSTTIPGPYSSVYWVMEGVGIATQNLTTKMRLYNNTIDAGRGWSLIDQIQTTSEKEYLNNTGNDMFTQYQLGTPNPINGVNLTQHTCTELLQIDPATLPYFTIFGCFDCVANSNPMTCGSGALHSAVALGSAWQGLSWP